MKIYKIATVLSLVIIIGCKEKSEKTENKIYYENFRTGKTLEQTEYNKINDSVSLDMEVIESILEKKTIKDSTIILYTSMTLPKGMGNPFQGVSNFIGKELPFKELKSLSGEIIDISKNNNKPTLVNLWFTSCPPCIEEMPELNELKAKFKGKVNFISITFDKEEKVRKFLEKNEFDFLHFVDARTELDLLNTKVYPTNIFLNKENEVYYVTANSSGGAFFSKILNRIL